VGKSDKQIDRCVISSFQIVESMGFRGEFHQWDPSWDRRLITVSLNDGVVALASHVSRDKSNIIFMMTIGPSDNVTLASVECQLTQNTLTDAPGLKRSSSLGGTSVFSGGVTTLRRATGGRKSFLSFRYLTSGKQAFCVGNDAL
jgi:hypothetical protein